MAATNETKSSIRVRALTVKEVRELRKAGLDPAFAKKDESADVTAGMIDWILEHIYAGQIPDDMPYNEALRIATDTYAETYGREREVKN